jgi:hypothetical protein
MTIRPVRSAIAIDSKKRRSIPHCEAGMYPATILLPQRVFHARFNFGRKFCLRYLANLFWKLPCDSAHVFQLFCVPLAEGAHEIMHAQLDPHEERQLFVHPQRQNANDLRARRCESANEQHDLQLKPTPVLLKNGVVIRWPGVGRPFWNWFQLFNGVPPGFRTSS